MKLISFVRSYWFRVIILISIFVMFVGLLYVLKTLSDIRQDISHQNLECNFGDISDRLDEIYSYASGAYEYAQEASDYAQEAAQNAASAEWEASRCATPTDLLIWN